MWFRLGRNAVLVAALVLLSAVVFSQSSFAESENGPDAAYRLGSGDKLHITIFNQTDFNGDYEIDSSGNVQLPLIGSFPAAGMTVAEFQKALTAKLSEGYFVNPNITVAVLNYRPFYIIGEVNKPGEYPYVSGMSILTAVALAGGYTTRANDSEAYIRRSGQNKEVEVPADESSKVQPGDIIRITERFF
jgi:polysaccharide export outer membrane protein